jgi:hypothetical protein
MPFGVLPPPPPKFYFNISYAKKDGAKKLGAKFDFENKCWYAPSAEVLVALLENNFLPVKLENIEELSAEECKTLMEQKIVTASFLY